MRLALITNMPSPYRFPVWDLLAHKVEALQVFLCSESEPNRIWRPEVPDGFSFSQTRLPGAHFFVQKMDWGLHFNPTIWAELKRFQPSHLLISGYESPSYLLALLYSKFHNIPITLWWVSHALSSRVHRGPIIWVKRLILKQFDSFCAASSLSKNYLTEEMYIPENKIAKTINTVDVYRWHAAAQKHRRDPESTDRPLRFLYVGQFLERKGILELLTAFLSVPNAKGILRLVGYGPQESQIRDFINQHNLVNVEIAGATWTIEETAHHYFWADVLVMPSLIEVWGLVVNEALASGVYVMASKFAGATYDLIECAPFDVGVSFDPAQNERFVGALWSVIEKRNNIDHQMISSWGLRHTPEVYADGLWNAISLAVR